MEENYYEKLKNIKDGKEGPIIEAEVVAETKVQNPTNEQAKEGFYKNVFENNNQNTNQGQPHMDDFQKQQYLAQVKFVLKKRFTSLSMLLGIFGLTMIIVSIVALTNNLTDEIMIESLEGIDWEITEANIQLMRNSYYLIYGIQIAIAVGMMYAAWLAKLGQYKALKVGRLTTIIAVIFAAFSFELLNLAILVLIYMNIRTTKSFIDNNVNQMNQK